MMSDPVSNTEIEDVLSSIRRLVSENRPLPEASDKVEDTAALSQGVAVQEVPAAAPKEAPLALVLTPALRVEDEPQQDHVDTDAEGEPEISEQDVQDDVAVELVEDTHQTDEPVVPQDAALEHDEECEVEAQPIGDDVDSASITPTSNPVVEDVAPEEAVDEEQPFDFKQVLETRIHQFRDATSAEEVPVGGASEAADVTEDMASVVLDELRVSMPEEAAQTIDVTPELSEALEDTAEIDEAMLREMVADIVRQELQGALGERITRNVRKLVRREIHRALAAHDLG